MSIKYKLIMCTTREFYINREFKLIQRYGRHSRIGATERRQSGDGLHFKTQQ